MNNLATLFIDESGKSSLIEKANEPFLITGVILDDSDRQIVEGFFGYIKLKYGIDPSQPFHSYDIFENPKTKLDDSDLNSLSIKLAEFIALIPAQIHITSINKSEFKSAIGIKSDEDFKGSGDRQDTKQLPYRVMATYLFAKFGKYLEKKHLIGQMIADSRRGADYQLIKTLNVIKQGDTNVRPEYQIAIKERLNAMCFAEKGYLSGGLEITDLISYTSFLRARKMITHFSNTGIRRVWKEIYARAEIKKIEADQIKRFFGIKKGEVHKYLR